MTEPSPDRAARRLAGDAGTTIVEVSLMAPVLLVILLGIFEYGMVFRDVLTIRDAVGDSVRYGAIVGPQPVPIPVSSGTPPNGNGDYWMLRRMRDATASIRIDDIERIVIFRGGPANYGSPVDQVPFQCRTGTSDGRDNSGLGQAGTKGCNRYNPRTAFQAAAGTDGLDYTYFDPVVTSGSPARHWPPSPGVVGGNTVLGRSNGSVASTTWCDDRPSDLCDQLRYLDYVGVFVRLKRSFVSRLFGSTFTYEEAQIVRLEPTPNVVS